MRIIAKTGKEDIATVYIADMGKGRLIEFVESQTPQIPRTEKWVLSISTLYGCPVGCRFCDAGSYYQGKLSREEIISQIDYLITNRYADGLVPTKKFKIQFARMGEPAFNYNVLDIIGELPKLYSAQGLIPSLSTIAPVGSERFFGRLREIKEDVYKGRFQLQFSIHTTDTDKRDWLIPVKKWGFAKIAEYGDTFYKEGDRKITLNFALGNDMPVDVQVLLDYFSPQKYFIKMTPVNPTYQASRNGISSHIQPYKKDYEVVDMLRDAGYEVMVSIGEVEENYIGSNCGQHITNYLNEKGRVKGGYTYALEEV